jgi:hypothetical protein
MSGWTGTFSLKGPTGDQGPQGFGYKLVGSFTGSLPAAAGYNFGDCIVSLDNYEINIVFNNKGDKDWSNTGVTFVHGTQGLAGQTGPAGEEKGFTGPVGPTGPDSYIPGPDGNPSYTPGPDGNAGPDAITSIMPSEWVGPNGEAGSAGKDATGDTGPRGPDGNTGTDVTTDPEWAGPTGEAGAKGPTGDTSITGSAGTRFFGLSGGTGAFTPKEGDIGVGLDTNYLYLYTSVDYGDFQQEGPK